MSCFFARPLRFCVSYFDNGIFQQSSFPIFVNADNRCRRGQQMHCNTSPSSPHTRTTETTVLVLRRRKYHRATACNSDVYMMVTYSVTSSPVLQECPFIHGIQLPFCFSHLIYENLPVDEQVEVCKSDCSIFQFKYLRFSIDPCSSMDKRVTMLAVVQSAFSGADNLNSTIRVRLWVAGWYKTVTSSHLRDPCCCGKSQWLSTGCTAVTCFTFRLGEICCRCSQANVGIGIWHRKRTSTRYQFGYIGTSTIFLPSINLLLCETGTMTNRIWYTCQYFCWWSLAKRIYRMCPY